VISQRGLRLALLDLRDRKAWQALPVLKASLALLACKVQRVQLVQLGQREPKATLAASGRKVQPAWLVLLALQVRKGRKAQQA